MTCKALAPADARALAKDRRAECSPSESSASARSATTSRFAEGAEDYYSGEGEAEGQWLGDAAKELGLGGVVEADQLTAMLTGRNPATGEPLASSSILLIAANSPRTTGRCPLPSADVMQDR